MRFSGIAVASLLAGSGPVTGVAPASITTKYRLEVKAETTLDLSAVGGPVQNTTANLAVWMAMTTTDSARGKAVRVHIDSVMFDGTAPIPKESVDSVRGTEIRGFIDGNGEVEVLNSTLDHALLSQVQGMTHSFFPKVKPGAARGDSWIDTSTVKNQSGGSNTTVVLVTTFTSEGPEAVSGIPAVKLGTKSLSTVTGTMENPMAGTMEVSGGGSTTGTMFVGADGRFLGGNSTTNMDQKLKLSMGAQIPVKTVQRVTVTVLP